MQRYLFDIHEGHSEFDDKGWELTSHDAARLTAVQRTAEILGEEPHRRDFGHARNLEGLTEAGESVCSADVRVSVPVADD